MLFSEVRKNTKKHLNDKQLANCFSRNEKEELSNELVMNSRVASPRKEYIVFAFRIS